MKRRSFLKGAGIVTVVVVGGGVWRAVDQGVFSTGDGPAYQPWKNWRDAKDSPLALVSAAILAASPHNTQPWLFKVSDSSIELHIDTSRNVGALDPYLREEHIGMGCALENLMLAAPANGYAATATLVPGKLAPIPAEPKPQLLARVDLAPGKREASELYNAIPLRHTN
ncbi:MAG: twin-arginine translocation signal domain-containing protein, partial [Candidatus Korobacteraceae bacterium]